MTNPWSFTETLLYFLLMDPAAPALVDPRPALPLTFSDAPAGRLIARTDWGPQATMFDFRASWISINHQLGDGGQFEVYRKGEWLTKEMSNYDNNTLGMTTPYHNTLGLKNLSANGTPTNLGWFEGGEWTNGSQWMLGASAGDPSTTTSVGTGYVFANSDLTNLYNRPAFWTPANAALAITHASRSIVWISPDHIAVYDRATSTAAGLFKRFHLNLVTPPTLSGQVATEVTPTGQRLFIQTLLPQNASASVTHASTNLSQIAELEPTQYQMAVEDLSMPADVRFLHVLQGADAGVPMDVATRLQSVGGTAFDGALFGSVAVFFAVDLHAGFVGTFLPRSPGVATMLVTGLAPNAGYAVTAQGGLVTITAGGASATTDNAGVLRLTLQASTPSRDFNGDGKSDILWRDTSGNLAMWLMNGANIAAGSNVTNVPTVWTVVGVGDFDGDGKADILWRDTSGNVALWLMNGATMASGGLLGNVPTTWTPVLVADFNGDGKADILWRDSSGNLALWLMNGATIASNTFLTNVATSWATQ